MALLWLLAACSHCRCTKPAEPAVAPVRTTTVTIRVTPEKEVSILAELAMRPEERERGLMFRETLEDGQGMLFAFPSIQVRSFWMKNTRIPLDMLFLDSDKRIVGIVHQAQPGSTKDVGVDEASQYVLEVPGGYCRRHGVRPGLQTRFELP
jgi:uncharacterized membrane protein (UPF0127 family)